MALNPYWWPPVVWVRGRIRRWRGRRYIKGLKRALLKKGWTVTSSADTEEVIKPPLSKALPGEPGAWISLKQPGPEGRVLRISQPRALPPGTEFRGWKK